MKEKEILKEIKGTHTYRADDKIFERVLSGIETTDRINFPFSRPKKRILRPAAVICITLLVIASTFAVAAAVNEDVRQYLISIFGGNPNSVNGEFIGITVEREGIELTVDAVVAEGNNLFMIYTLKDKSNGVFQESASINKYKFSVGGDSQYNATYNSDLKNGEKNYMILYGDDAKKGIQNVQFSLESLKTPDPGKEFILPAGTADYQPQGIPGYTIEYVKLNNNRIEAAISVSNEEEYIRSYNLRVVNTKTGKTFSQTGEGVDMDTEGDNKRIQWYSEELDGGKEEDYQLILPFDRVFTFKSPLIADFSVDFSRSSVKTIHPQNVKVLDYTVEKVTVHQMIITADLVTDQKAVLHDEAEAPVPADSEPPFLEEKAPGIHGQRMTVRYEDGTEADSIGGFSTSHSQDRYRFNLVLNGSLDYSRKPILFIGETGIPLY